MATIALNYYCDLNQAVKVQYIDGNVFSGDNAGNTISVYVMDGDQPATIGGSVSADVIRADGSTVAVSGALDGNRAYVILPQACYAVPGSISIVIKNTQNTTITTIAALVGNVYRSSTDEIVDPGTIIPSISSLIAAIDAAIGSIPADYSALLASIAADYSSSKTYPVGAYCWEAGVLKRCIVPITSAETYTAAHWTNAVIGDDLSALKSAITFNANNFLYGNLNYESRALNGITFAWSAGVCTITGNWNTSPTVTPTSRLYNQSSKLPEGIVIGKRYFVSFKATDPNVELQITPYVSGTLASNPILKTSYSDYEYPASFVLPANTTGMLVRVAVTKTNTQISATTTDVCFFDCFPQGWLTEDKYNRNLLNLFGAHEARTVGNIAFAWNGERCLISSTDAQAASSLATSRFYSNTSAMPSQIIPGEKYLISFSATKPGVYFEIDCYQSGGSLIRAYVFKTDGVIRVPSETIGVTVRLTVPSGTTIEASTIVTKCEIHNFDETEKFILPPTGDTRDRTLEIEQTLEALGVCNLAAGQYYVGQSRDSARHGVVMPVGSSLCGAGNTTEVILSGLDSVSGFAIKLNSLCTVENLSVKGNTTDHNNNSDVYSDDTYVNRHGIIWDGVFTENKELFDDTTETPAKAMLRNLWICNFSGGGITLNNTGTNVYRGITVSDCTIWYCYAGINIRYYSEFNKFTNVASTHCNFGCINNGGNNIFANCNFSANVLGFIINNYQDKSPNNGHGSVTNCIFDHSGGNTGIGIRLINVTPGFVFSGCQLFYSSIKIEDSNGIIFEGLNAGWGPNDGGTHHGETIIISGGSLVMFNGCGFRIQPQITVTNNDKVKFINCYAWDGTAVEP